MNAAVSATDSASRLPSQPSGSNLDPAILCASLTLLCLGIVMVGSASIAMAGDRLQQPFYFLIRQALYAGLGVLVAGIALHVSLATWHRLSPYLLIIAVALLVLVLVPGIGREVNGSMRWIAIGPVNIQPSEIAKLFSLIYMASYLQRHAVSLQLSTMAMLRPLFILGILALLLLAEPDFGSVVVLMAIAFGMVFLAGANLWRFVGLQMLILAAMTVLLYSSDYRRARLMSFLDPWADPFNSGFQLTQSLIAIGRGELWGVGIGASIQKLNYLPEAHTDFLFAILAEELGLIGIVTIIGLYGLIVVRAFAVGQTALRVKMPFAAYLAYGIGLWFALQALVNMGVNMGVLPTKGLTLPLMSYGGSSIVVMCLALAILLRSEWEVRMATPRKSAADRLKERPVLIMAGGTGGHVFPALAVAQQLRSQGVPVVWMGTRHGLEARVVPKANIPCVWVGIEGLRGRGWQRLVMAPLMILRAVVQALWHIRRIHPRVVLGMGGFVSGPGGIAAWLLRIPLVIHEQNAIAGFTNRRLAWLAHRIVVAFPDSFPAHRQPLLLGNPVRADITTLPPPTTRLANRSAPWHLLILGGSQGAAALNHLVPLAIQHLSERVRLTVWHQAGNSLFEETEQAYRQAGVRAQVTPFIEDMAKAYGWADLVICRAGALTLAELTAVGIGAILVPYPHAVDDHQTANAQYLVQAGAALLIPQDQLTAALLADHLHALFSEPARVRAMAEAARRLAKPQAAWQVADLCLSLSEVPA